MLNFYFKLENIFKKYHNILIPLIIICCWLIDAYYIDPDYLHCAGPSMSEVKADIDYWQTQNIQYKDMMIKEGLDVDDNFLTDSQKERKKEFLEAIKESRSNVSHYISLLKIASSSSSSSTSNENASNKRTNDTGESSSSNKR